MAMLQSALSCLYSACARVAAFVAVSGSEANRTAHSASDVPRTSDIFIPFFDGLRVLALWGVCLFHAVQVLGFRSVLSTSVMPAYSGYHAVDTYFFISGFLLSRSLLTDAPENVASSLLTRQRVVGCSFRAFPAIFLKRLLRLMPVVITVVILNRLVYRPTCNWLEDLPFVTLTMPRVWPCSSVSWSIAADIHFHFLYPLALITFAHLVRMWGEYRARPSSTLLHKNVNTPLVISVTQELWFHGLCVLLYVLARTIQTMLLPSPFSNHHAPLPCTSTFFPQYSFLETLREKAIVIRDCFFDFFQEERPIFDAVITPFYYWNYLRHGGLMIGVFFQSLYYGYLSHVMRRFSANSPADVSLRTIGVSARSAADCVLPVADGDAEHKFGPRLRLFDGSRGSLLLWGRLLQIGTVLSLVMMVMLICFNIFTVHYFWGLFPFMPTFLFGIISSSLLAHVHYLFSAGIGVLVLYMFMYPHSILRRFLEHRWWSCASDLSFGLIYMHEWILNGLFDYLPPPAPTERVYFDNERWYGLTSIYSAGFVYLMCVTFCSIIISAYPTWLVYIAVELPCRNLGKRFL